MKELDSFTVERLGEIKNAFLDCHKETAPSIGEIFALIDIALAAKRADSNILADSVNEFLKALDDYKDQLVPINRNSALVNDLRKALSSPPQLNSPEMPDYKSALLGLLTNRISKDHLGFFTLAEINKTNLARAVEVSEATINFENVPQVKIGECLIPNGWLITQDWIKCSDHKPDSSGEFLVYETLNNRVQHDYWVPDDCAALGLGFWNHYANYVTHWMPLPTAPEKENG